MAEVNLSELTIKKTHELLKNGGLSTRELADFYLNNISEKDNGIKAFLEVFDDVYKQAEEVDKKIKSGQNIPLLAGLPFAVKDNILIKNRKCSAASKILENFIAPYDATVINKLKKEQVVFLGRANMDEFAMGGSTEHSAFFTTKNPYDSERVAGGSSGGSAAAVAAQECFAALGSDTGGSVRQPAGFCGVVGLKPTYGAVSRYGLMAMASSLDQIGPLSKCVEDAEIIFNAIKGKDPQDSTTADSSNLPLSDSDNMKVGIPKEYFSLAGESKGIDEDVVLKTKEALEILKSAGCVIKEISIPALEYAIAIYYILMPAEVSSNLSRYDGVKYGLSKKGENLLGDYVATRSEGFGKEAQRRILLGTYVLSAGYYDAYYNKAQKAREILKEDFKKAFQEVDVILSPTSPTPAFKIGEKTSDPVQMYLADIFTVAANLVGVPAISLPFGFVSRENKKLPNGIHLMAPWFEENKLFSLGKMIESGAKQL